MAKKKIEPITSLGNEDKLTVQKSLPLFALWRSDLTLAEFKILDTYLSRIDSHKPEKRAVIFEKGELEKLLGVQKINNKELEERLKHLMGNVVKIPDTDERKGFRLISLFEEAVAEQDDYGLWQVKLECTQKAMKYIFNIENLGYLRYKIRCITSITSRYTYIMFIYLESNRFRKSWEVPLAELKEILNCDKEELYKEFKFFNQKILKRVQKEMHEKTECRYSYEPVKKGRKVSAVRFEIETFAETLSTLSDELGEENPKQLKFDDVCADELEEDIDYGGELANLLGSSACNNEFTPEQVRVIQDLVLKAKKTTDYDYDYIELDDFLSHKIHLMNLYDQQKKIKNRFAYLCKMIEKGEN